MYLYVHIVQIVHIKYYSTMEYNSLKDFRENTREAFNSAERGEKVLIMRYGRVFSLSLTDLASMASVERREQGLCPIHDIPLTNRGTCLQKGCKYA